MENAVLFLWDGWGILGRVVALLAVVTAVLGLENLIVKLVADIQSWRRRREEPTVEMLRRKQEGCTAILVPITASAPLAGAVLARLKRSIEYENYMIFVGVRSIDAPTVEAIQREARADSRVQLCLYDLRGAASQARALNALLDAVRGFEHQNDVDFQTYFVQGPETIVHPLVLRLANWHCEFASIVQFPVFTMPRGSLPITGGAGLDDLGEHRARELLLRAQTVKNVPVLDTGLAFRRDAIWALKLHGDVFDKASPSPIFDAVRRIGERGHLSTFVWQRDEHRQVIGVRELSARRFRDAIEAKARRLSLITFGNRQPLGGTQSSLWERYFNYRDRRIVLVAATLACAGLTAIAAAALLLAGRITPGFESMPPLVDAPWVLAVLVFNGVLACAALVERIALTARTRGPLAALLLPLNLFTSAPIWTRAVLRASSRQRANDADQLPAQQRSPTGSSRLAGKPKITDILVHSGAMSKDAAKLAKAYSRRTRRQILLALQDLRLADGAAIAKALSEKLGLEFAHIDGPLDTYASVFLSTHEAERFCAFAQRAGDGGVDVYIGEDYTPREWRALRAALRRAGVQRPNFRTAPLGEIAYAIRFAGTAQEMAVEQAIAVSLMDGPIPEGSASDIRRQLRAPYRRLEDLLVERGLIRPRRILRARKRIGIEGPGLEDVISRDPQIPPFTLAETVREFNDWRPAIAPLTSFAPMARYNAHKPTLVDPRLAA